MKKLLMAKLVFVGLFFLSLGLVLKACGGGGGGGGDPIVYILTVNKTGEGTVTSSPAGGQEIDCGPDCIRKFFVPGEHVTLTATAGAGYTFSSWAGCDSTSGSSCMVTMNQGRTVTANFVNSLAIPLKTNVIRTLQPGDTWNYAVTGALISYGVSGTLTFQVMTAKKWDPIESVYCLDRYATHNLTFSGTIPPLVMPPLVTSVHDYLLQDFAGSIYIYGTDFTFGDTWVSAASGGKFLSTQSPMSIGQNYEVSVAFTDGTTSTLSSSVVAIEDVQTNSGEFQAYKITVNATINFPYSIKVVQNNTMWYVPGLGNFVKYVSDATTYSENDFRHSLRMTFTLTGTSVSY